MPRETPKKWQGPKSPFELNFTLTDTKILVRSVGLPLVDKINSVSNGEGGATGSSTDTTEQYLAQRLYSLTRAFNYFHSTEHRPTDAAIARELRKLNLAVQKVCKILNLESHARDQWEFPLAFSNEFHIPAHEIYARVKNTRSDLISSQSVYRLSLDGLFFLKELTERAVDDANAKRGSYTSGDHLDWLIKELSVLFSEVYGKPATQTNDKSGNANSPFHRFCYSIFKWLYEAEACQKPLTLNAVRDRYKRILKRGY